ncbi:phage regulatory CII family protein [Roseomonas chloroacetimidivorans]|uniref:phage regulatory CII family protein n=1 Tax=Roseomonas chloroacetimidivorans TaxID=1766656 RepID=UPI003C7584BB
MSFVLTPEDAKLKHLTRALNEDAGGTEAAAAALRGRVGATMLGNYQSLNHAQMMPIDVLIRLTLVTGNAELLEEVARRAGYRIEKIGGASVGNAIAKVAAVARETNEALQALAAGLSDGHLSDQDNAAIQGEMLDVVRAATEAVAAFTPAPGGEA